MLRRLLLLCSLAPLSCAPAVPPQGPGPAGASPAAAGAAAVVDEAADPFRRTALPPGYRFPAGDTFRVATWNVEHFVDLVDDPYVDAEIEDSPPPGQAERIVRLAEALRRLDADVVVLQEFEGLPFLRAWVEERLEGEGYRFLAGSDSPDWYQNVVVLSRLPLGALTSLAAVTLPVEGATDRAGRPEATSLVNHRIWSVEVLARPGYVFTLVGLHLKAGGGERNRGWRLGQIRFLRGRLEQGREGPYGENVLIAGDLNATPGSPEISLLRGEGGPLAFADPLGAVSPPTFPTGAPNRRIDYLLPSEGMAEELVPGSTRVARPLPPAEMAALSDHLPVVASFVADEQSPGEVRPDAAGGSIGTAEGVDGGSGNPR